MHHLTNLHLRGDESVAVKVNGDRSVLTITAPGEHLAALTIFADTDHLADLARSILEQLGKAARPATEYGVPVATVMDDMTICGACGERVHLAADHIDAVVAP